MSELQLAIAPPDESREPRKVNVYEFTRAANSQLAALFPYDGPGALVASGGIMRGGGGESFGYFIHENTQDEVVVCFGARSARFRPGQVAVGARTHGVGGHDPSNPNDLHVVVITQRQSEAQTQSERIAFICEKCQGELFSHRFDVVLDEEKRGAFAPLDTIRGSHEAASQFNADESKRTCARCGHVNPPFPDHLWGWRDYIRQTDIVKTCRELFTDVAPRPGGSE